MLRLKTEIAPLKGAAPIGGAWAAKRSPVVRRPVIATAVETTVEPRGQALGVAEMIALALDQ